MNDESRYRSGATNGQEDAMPAQMKRARLRPSRTRGRWRNIPQDRARDEDLHVFLQVSRLSREAIRGYINGVIGTA